MYVVLNNISDCRDKPEFWICMSMWMDGWICSQVYMLLYSHEGPQSSLAQNATENITNTFKTHYSQMKFLQSIEMLYSL